MILWNVLWLFPFFWQGASTAKILAFLPVPWKSHQNVYRPLIRQLALKGHHVDFYTPMPMPNPPKGLRQFKVSNWYEAAMGAVDEDFSECNVFTFQHIMSKSSWSITESTFKHDKVSVDLLQSNETYDLVLSEFTLYVEPLVYLAHKFKAINIAVVGLPDNPWVNEMAGLPNNPAYMVTLFTALTDRLNFLQRIYNLYVNMAMNAASAWGTVSVQQARADKYIRYDGWETRPKIMEMIGETALYLINSHVSTGFAYPKAPHVKEISGMHIEDPQPLPNDLQTFLDDAPDGVIYFSLGSVLDPKELLIGGIFEIFVEVFRQLNQKIVWKLPEEMPKLEDPKFFVRPWFPQQAVLNHKNIKMFVTHGGLQSTIEAIAYGVPCLGIPYFLDQKKDVTLLEHFQMGMQLSFDNITETTLSRSINEVLTNPKYWEHAKKRQSLFYDRPMKPVDEAVYWIEYVLRHGKVLVPASAKMPFYQLYLLDIAAVVICSVIVIICIFKMVLSALFKLFRPKMLMSPSKKKN